MSGIRRILAQSRPAGTSAVTLFTQGYDDPVEVETLHLCNVTAADVVVSVFHDADGTTFDGTTALVYQHVLPANGWITLDDIIGEWTTSGAIGIQTGTADSVVFTLYGRAAFETIQVLQLNEGVV